MQATTEEGHAAGGRASTAPGREGEGAGAPSGSVVVAVERFHGGVVAECLAVVGGAEVIGDGAVLPLVVVEVGGGGGAVAQGAGRGGGEGHGCGPFRVGGIWAPPGPGRARPGKGSAPEGGARP